MVGPAETTNYAKKSIMCDVCSEFKAKFTCERCDKTLCVKHKTRFGETNHMYGRDSVCFECRDELEYKNARYDTCKIL